MPPSVTLALRQVEKPGLRDRASSFAGHHGHVELIGRQELGTAIKVAAYHHHDRPRAMHAARQARRSARLRRRAPGWVSDKGQHGGYGGGGTGGDLGPWVRWRVRPTIRSNRKAHASGATLITHGLSRGERS